MTAEIIDFSQFRRCRAATGPDTFQGVRLPGPDKDWLTPDELDELERIFPASREALQNEAVEQAFIEQQNSPIDLSNFPVCQLEDFRAVDRIIKVRQLRLMVDRTAQLLREYLEAYRSLK